MDFIYYMFHFILLELFNAAKNYNNGLIWKILALISATIGTVIYIQNWINIMDTLSFLKSLI